MGTFIKENFIFILLLILSFSIYAPVNYVFLNSDQGIHALMASSFDFEYGTYYWGQNRLGSILPFFSHLLVVLGVDPLWAVSLVQYTFLGVSIYLLQQIFKSKIIIVSVVILILFPLAPFIEVLNIGHPYAPQIFLIFALYVVSKKVNNNLSINNIIKIIIFWVIVCLSIWVSELSLIPIALIFGLLVINLVDKIWNKSDSLVRSPFFYSVPIASYFIFRGFKIIKSKHPDPNFESYGVNSLSEALEAYRVLFQRFIDSFTYATPAIYVNTFTIFITVLFLGLTLYILIKTNWKEIFKTVISESYIVFFIIAISTFGAIGFSEWAGIEFYPHRYYVFSYIFFVIGLALLLEKSCRKGVSKKLSFIYLVLSIVGSLSFIRLDKEQGRYRTTAESISQISLLNSCAIIGDYWYSYVIGSYNANQIISIASEQSHLRNPHQLDQAFSKDNIYLVKNNWMDVFPDTVMQYRRILVKQNETDITIGNAILHRYVNLSNEIIKENIQKISNLVKKDTKKMALILQVAAKTNVPAEQIIKKNAEKLVHKEMRIKIMEDRILNDTVWLKSIKQKAEENKISTEEMIRLDAEYIINLEDSK